MDSDIGKCFKFPRYSVGIFEVRKVVKVYLRGEISLRYSEVSGNAGEHRVGCLGIVMVGLG